MANKIKKNMLNIISYEGNANLHHDDIPLLTQWRAIKIQIIIGIGENMKKSEP